MRVGSFRRFDPHQCIMPFDSSPGLLVCDDPSGTNTARADSHRGQPRGHIGGKLPQAAGPSKGGLRLSEVPTSVARGALIMGVASITTTTQQT